MTEILPPPNSRTTTPSTSEEEKIEQEETKEQSVNLLQVKRIISTLSLTTVKVGYCLLIMRSEFDIALAGEPYIALMLLLDLRSGKYISRIWNQTVETGSVFGGKKLMEACKNLFCQGRPCVGYPVTETVFPRKHSSTCSRVIGTDVGAEVTACQECSKESLNNITADGLIKEDMDGEKSDKCALDDVIAEDGDQYESLTSITETINMGDFLEDGIKADQNKSEIKCPWCEKHFDSNCRDAFLNHQKRIHFWGNFKCSECTYKANFAKDLTDHIQREEDHSKDARVRCPYCRIDHPYEDIKSHYESCVSRFVHSEDDSDILMGTQKLEDSGELATSHHKCDMCEKSFTRVSNLNKHKNNVHNSSKHHDDGEYSVSNACSICKKIFTKEGNRWGHMVLQHFYGRFRCPMCHAAAETVALLTDHIREKNYSQKLFPECPCCKNRFHLENLQPHYEGCVVKAQREKQKRWGCKGSIKCPTCGKTLATKKTYEDHMKIHMRKQGLSEAEAKTSLYYYCEQCGVKCATIKNLRHHVKSMHNEGPFPCPDCGLEFAKWSSMKIHQRKEHKPLLQCDICDYKTDQHPHMKTHKIKHFDPTFKCCYCGKMFKREKTLEAHEREHRGEKPFSCSVCGAGFAGRSYLRQHMRGVHGIAPRGGKTGWYKKEKQSKVNG